MKSFLILPHIRVENANAIAGITYGFPSVTQFLGYVHTLSREINRKFKVKLGGCGIICHDYHVHAHRSAPYREFFFSLAKHPLTKEGKTPSLNEEGKMHMEISLVIECSFKASNFNFETGNVVQNNKKFEEWIFELAFKRPLAGGVITSMSEVEYYVPSFEGKFIRSSSVEESKPFSLKQLLPGYVLLDRSHVLKEHLSNHPEINALDALLDFYTIKSRSFPDSKENKKWENIPKPKKGWFVPLHIGYQAISPLYENHEIKRTRDQTTPFRFVEPLFGLGEWVGIHREIRIKNLLWNYGTENDSYICYNKK